MKRRILLLLCSLVVTLSASAQLVGVKTNVLGWAMHGTMNVGLEPALTPNLTLAVDGYYNPFTYSDGNSTKLWGVQPEVRYWFKTKYAGLYAGVNSLYSSYDYGMRKYRYDGWMTGAGLGVGYSLPFADRWRATAGIGGGWVHREYDKSGLPQRPNDIFEYGSTVKDIFSLTKAEISITFIIR